MADRRKLIKGMTLGGYFYTIRGAFADALTLTPAMTVEPCYPDRRLLDLDNDLLIINDGITPGVGEISWVAGKVLDKSGSPIREPPQWL